MAQAEQARKNESPSVIADIKAKMKQFGITVADLGGAALAAPRKVGKSKSAAPAKYRGPNGELWAGGPGRKPEWVRAVWLRARASTDYRI